MLRRAGLVALAAVLLAIAVTALASATGRESDDRKVEVLKLDFATLKATEVDLGEEGPSQANRFVSHVELLHDGESVGELGYDCVDIDLNGRTGFTAHCMSTASLPGGQVAAQGLITFTADPIQRFSLAVTGGTGDYRTARGEVRVEERFAEGAGTLTVTILR